MTVNGEKQTWFDTNHPEAPLGAEGEVITSTRSY